AAHSARPPVSDPHDGAREPLLGSGANCQRVAGETRPARVAAHHPEISAGVARPASWQPSPRSAVVNLSQESRGGHHRLRLLRGSECHFSNPLRAGGHGTCFTPDYSSQRDCSSERGLDPPTAAGGDSLGPYVPVYPA